MAIGQAYSVRLISGRAEIFGVELAPSQTYDFTGRKGAVLTWHGCQLEITGEAESEYLSQETEYAVEWLNVHGMLETVRDEQPEGPSVLVVGPDHSGKTSFVRSLAAWDVKTGRTPTIVNLDSREGLLAPPSSLTAITIGSPLDVENGFGISSVSGPTAAPVRTPLVYHHPYASPAAKEDVYKAVITRMALSVTNKLEEDASAKQCGILIDTPGSLNDPRSDYNVINHIVSEFSIQLILTIGSERLYNDLNKRLNTSKSADEAITVLRISKPEGAAERDATFMRQLRTQQIRQYFFGTPKEALNPHSQSVNFADLSMSKAKSASNEGSNAPDMDDDDDIPYSSHMTSASNASFEKVTPSLAMTGSLVAIKFCPGNSDEIAVRDSAVMGFLYVADVDETRKKVRFLAPHPQRWGDRALVWGSWPEPVADLVA